MSAVKEFNSLGGKVVSRNTLEKLAKKAFDEQSFEVHKRVSAILDNHPKAQEFEFEPNSIKKINEKSSLGIPVKLEVFSKQIGKDLVFFYGERKLATIRPNGLIEYETNKFPRGAKTRIRHASSKVGLNSPFDEDMLHGLELLPDGDSYGLGKPVSPNEIYDNITNLMINTIKQVGYLPWQKEWVGSGIVGARNFVTGKPYSGINFFTLNYVVKYDNEGNPYLVSATTEPQYFLTYNQIESFGATIKKGKKARQVVYYNFVLNYKEGNLNFSGTDANKFAEFAKKNQLSEAQVESNLKRFPILKYYNVFNSNDVDGLPSPKFYEKVVNVNEYAQFVIDNYPNKPDYRFGSEKAFYSPSGDYVSMPLIRAFKKESSYYSTFFHEITHSTGHKSRLDRDMSGMFGNKKYAFEELIAELGATYLCSETGILFEVLDNSAKYLKGWSKKLISKMEEDNKFFFKAAAAAQKAANFILDTNNPKRKKFVDKKPKTETKTPKSETKKPKTVKKPVVKETPKSFDKKPKSVSVATAIKDVLTLPKYKGVKLLLATIIYNKFKNFDDEDFFEVQISSNFEKGVLKTKSDLHDFFEYAEELSLTEKGVEFVKAVNGRLESLRNQKNNYALFDKLASPTELAPKKAKTVNKNAQTPKKPKHKATQDTSKVQESNKRVPRKKPIKKSALANPEPIVEQIEVIEPNPIIPIAVELPTNQPEVLDQVNTVEVVEPITKINLNPNSLAARKNKNTQPREFYIIENSHIAKLLGNIEKKVKESVAITIAGGQGSGKSSFIFQLIEEFSKNYRVGHASIEEHPESSLYEKKAERYWSEKAFNTVDAPEIKTIEDLDALIKRNDVIVIDSFSKLKSMDKRLTLDDGLRKKYDNKLFIIIYQLTTNNTMRGGSDSQFDGDTILFVEKFPDFNENYVYVDKNRYATDISPDLKYNISQQKIIQDDTETEEIQFSDQIETI